MKIKNLLPMICVLFLISCSMQPTRTSQNGNTDNLARVKVLSEKYLVSRFIDEEAGVVCWITGGKDGASNSPYGISCLPLSSTSLAK